MMRKGFIYGLAILLAVLPLIGSFSKEAAAASSRVAVIKELKGTVKVKKAGGSKEFTAFAKMSLNEGDVLAVGSGGSAVLQFANGSSEDDKMTVASNTKLTFSKLSNSKGTTTKVSMWSGSAWADVKSITNKDDKFTLETPTAVMGVRGTHLLVTVNPEMGATRLMVAAGVVQTTTTGNDGETKNVYPTQNALITEAGADKKAEITIASADLETLMKQGNADIVRAIIQGAADITAENEQYVDRYEKGEVPKEIGGTSADLARFKNNTQNLLGALANQAVQSGLISQERMNQIIEEANSQTGYKVDIAKGNLQLTEIEKTQQELQRKKEAEAAKLAAERKAKEEAERKKQEEALRKIEEARKAQQKAAQEAAEAKKKKAGATYEGKLSEADKARYKAEEEKRKAEEKAAQSNAASSTGTSTGSTSTSSGNANLSGLSVLQPGSSMNLVDLGTPDPGFADRYTITVGNTVGTLTVIPNVAQSNASVTVQGHPLVGGKATATLNSSGTSDGTTTTIPIVVTAQNGTKKTYTVIVNRQASLLTSPLTISGIPEFVFKPDQGEYTLNPVSGNTSTLTLNFGEVALYISVTNNGEPVSSDNGEYEVPLAKGDNRILITVTSGGLIQTYTINVVREPVPEHVTSWSIDEAPLKRVSEIYGEGYKYKASVAVAENTRAIHLDMLLEKGVASPVFVHIFDEGFLHQLASYDGNADGDIVISDQELELDMVNPYTTIEMEYKVGNAFYYIELIVLRGEPGDEDYAEVDGVSIAYGEYEIVETYAYGQSSFIGMLGSDGLSSSFGIMPQLDYEEVVDVYQLINGSRVKLDWGPMGFNPIATMNGWNDFEINVWDRSVQRSKKMYDVHIYRGQEVPESFAGTHFEANGIAAIGASISNVSQWFVEVPEGADEALVRLPAVGLPGNVHLLEVSEINGYEQSTIAPDNAGYYHLPIDEDISLAFLFGSGSRQFAYFVRAVPEVTFSLDTVKLYNETEFQNELHEEVDFAVDEYVKNVTIPLNITHLSLKPYISNDYSNLRVTVDGVVKAFEYYPAPGRYSTTRFAIGTGKTVVIEITSPSGHTQKTYTLNLNRPYVAGALNSLYLMPSNFDFSKLNYATPVDLGDNTYFSSYKGAEASLLLNVVKAFGSGDVKVFLDDATEPLPFDGSNFELSNLSEGWHAAKIKIDDSQNSGNPTVYKQWIWVGEQPPSGFAFSGIYAEDGDESPTEFYPDATGPFKWTTDVLPNSEVLFIGKTLVGGSPEASVTKVVYSGGLLAEDDAMFEITLDDDLSTEAQMWVENNGQIFVYPLQVNLATYKPRFVTTLESSETRTGDYVSWEYDDTDADYDSVQYTADADISTSDGTDPAAMTEGIMVNMTPVAGYSIAYSASIGTFNSTTGQWSGLTTGHHTLTVTISKDGQSRTYKFYLNVYDSSTWG